MEKDNLGKVEDLLDYYNYDYFKLNLGLSFEKIDENKEDYVLKFLKIVPHKKVEINTNQTIYDIHPVKLWTLFLNKKELISFLKNLESGTDFYNLIKIKNHNFYVPKIKINEGVLMPNNPIMYINIESQIGLKPKDLKNEFFTSDISIFNHYFKEKVGYHNTSCPLYLFELKNSHSKILFKFKLFKLGLAILNKKDKNLRLVVSYKHKEQQKEIIKYFPFAFYLCNKFSRYSLYGDKKRLIELRQNNISWDETNYFELYKEIFTLISPILIFLFSVAFQYYSKYSLEIFYFVITFTLISIIIYYFLKNKYDENKSYII